MVTDNNGATDSDTVLVTVNAAPLPGNQSPNANAGTDITITLPTNNTTLNGSASSDPDGTISTYSWTKISGPATFTICNPALASTALTNLIQGTYGFRLVVTDNNGATDSDSVFVTVNAAIPPANQTPNANAGADISVNLPNPVILLNGSASSDPDGTIVGFNWIKISGAGAITIVNSTTATPNVVGVQQGVYVFELTVTDNNGATAKDQVTVTVGVGPNQAPVALAGNDTSMAVPASSSLLNGSSSFDSDGSIVAFTWRQVSGPSLGAINSSFNAITSVSSLIAGDYSYELTVTDDKGAIDRDTVTISIVDNLRSEDVLIVYPNPAMSNLNVRCISDSMGIGKLNFYNLNGILEKSIQFTKSQTFYEKQFQIADLKTGMYYIEVIIDNRKRMVKKFIKQ